MDEPKIRRRCPLWVKIVLTLSLAINLLIAGVVAGFALRGGPLGGKGPSMGYAMPYVIALPPEDRRDVFEAVRNNRDLPGRGARRGVYRDMISTLQTTPFDRAAVETLLDRQAAGVEAVQAVAQGTWLDKIDKMSDAERADYAERVRHVLDRGKRRR